MPIKKPILNMKIVNNNPDFHEGIMAFSHYIKEEVNTFQIEEEANEDEFITYSVDWDQRALGKRLKGAWKGLQPKL